MAYIEIRKGKKRNIVSEHQFETLFAPRGWIKVEEKKVVEETIGFVQDEQEEQVREPDELETTPINSMSKAQLKAYAERHDIDITGTKSFAEAKKRVQDAIKQLKM